jgi:hypothetical protein
LWRTYKGHFGVDDDPILVLQAPTALVNPTIPQRVIDEAFQADPAAAASEWGAQFRRDIEAWVAPEAVDAATIPGRFELPPMSGVHYVAFTDPSGGASDSFTLAVAHYDTRAGVVVLDALRESKPPFSPKAVVAEYAETLRRYNCSTVYGDRYGGEWPREVFRGHRIQYQPATRTKSELYRGALPKLNSGQVELLDNKRLTAQLASLERRVSRGGRELIDHPPGGRDDIANAACGALVTAFDRRPSSSKLKLSWCG